MNSQRSRQITAILLLTNQNLEKNTYRVRGSRPFRKRSFLQDIDKEKIIQRSTAIRSPHSLPPFTIKIQTRARTNNQHVQPLLYLRSLPMPSK